MATRIGLPPRQAEKPVEVVKKETKKPTKKAVKKEEE